MKKISVISILMIGVFLMSGIATVALASSLIPSPYNLIHSTELKLIALDQRIDTVLGYHPPDPARYLNRIVRTLEAVADGLNVLNRRLSCVIAVLPSSEEAPEEILAALENARDKANILLLRARTGYHPPDPILPPCFPPDPVQPPDPIHAALESVASGAQVTIDIVDAYLRSVPPTGE